MQRRGKKSKGMERKEREGKGREGKESPSSRATHLARDRFGCLEVDAAAVFDGEGSRVERKQTHGLLCGVAQWALGAKLALLEQGAGLVPATTTTSKGKRERKERKERESKGKQRKGKEREKGKRKERERNGA